MEADLMRRLSGLVHEEQTRARLQELALRLRDELQSQPDSKSTAAVVPLELYGDFLPGDVRSSWVFVLRENYDHPAERHPNSIQRMFALDSAGAMEVWEDGAWRHRPLSPGADDPGLSIPAYAWHRPARLGNLWGVVSFHTVPAAELIEEVGDPETGLTQQSRHYIK